MKPRLIVLEELQIASPCSEPWEGMRGDDRVRHCARCDLDVFNLSGMTREAATALVHGRTGGQRMCGRLLKRRDGTVITQDCPVGLSRARRRLLLVAAAVLSFAGLTGIATLAAARAASGSGGDNPDVLGSSTTVQAFFALFSAKPLPVATAPHLEIAGLIMVPPSTPAPVPQTPNSSGTATP